MRAWRVCKASRARDLSGQGAAIIGGRWNHMDIPALYLGLGPAICCLETFVHASGRPTVPLTITCLELPDDPALYTEPTAGQLPNGWSQVPADRASMDYGSAWLREGTFLGLIVPSAVLPLERNMVINPQHPAARSIVVTDRYAFTYDERMFKPGA